MGEENVEFIIWLNKQVERGIVDDWEYDEKEDKIIVYQSSGARARMGV